MAVAERPGRSDVGWIVHRHHDFEIAGFLGIGRRLRGGRLPGGAQNGQLAHLAHVALENLAGERVDGDFGGLALADVGDVGLIHFHFRGDDAHVRNRHQETAFGVLNSGYDVFAHAHSDVTDNAINRRRIGCFAQNVLVCVSARPDSDSCCRAIDRARRAPVPLVPWRRSGRDRAVVSSFVCVEVLLGYELIFVEFLGALPIEFGLFQVRLALGERRHRGIVIRCGHAHARFGGADAGLLGLNVRARLDVFQVQQNVALLDVVAFFHHDFRDLPDALTQDVGVILWAGLRRRRSRRGQVLPDDLAALHRHNALVRLVDAVPRICHRRTNTAPRRFDTFFHVFITYTSSVLTSSGRNRPLTCSYVRRSQNVSRIRRS